MSTNAPTVPSGRASIDVSSDVSSSSSISPSTSASADGERAIRELLEGLLAAFMSKDLPAVMHCFADDALFYDPHYPQPRMVGRAAIEQGMGWGMAAMAQPGFTVRRVWIVGESGAMEVDTHHRLQGGMEVKFEQAFVFETRAGKLTRLQSYVPFRPLGIGGLIGKATGLVWRLQGKLK